MKNEEFEELSPGAAIGSVLIAIVVMLAIASVIMS